MLEAAAALEGAGRGDLAAEVRRTAALDAVHGRWTYQMVDEYRSHLLGPVRAMDAGVRQAVTGGVRHCFEADQKRHTEGALSGTAVRAPAAGVAS